jgi:hypothetical protein
MAKTITATDRKALIRLASSMDKGSPQRLVILAGLKKEAIRKKLRRFPGFVWESSTEYDDGGSVAAMPGAYRRLLGRRWLYSPNDEEGSETVAIRVLKRNGYKLTEKKTVRSLSEHDPENNYMKFEDANGSVVILDFNDYGAGLSISLEDVVWGSLGP